MAKYKRHMVTNFITIRNIDDNPYYHSNHKKE